MSKATIKTIFTLFALSLSAAAQPQTITGKVVGVSDGDSLNGLQLSFELIEDRFRQNDRIRNRVKLTNIGKEPITIYKRGWVASGLQVIVRDTKGLRVPEEGFTEPSSSFHPLAKEDFPEKDFVTLAPEESYVTTIHVCVCNFMIKGPGDYSIAATYDNPVPPYLAPKGVKLWGQNDEKLRTKPMKFTVIE